MQPKPHPISLRGARKGDVRTQFAALCYRMRRGKVQILLVTSRRTKRWILPKGWPMDGKTPGASAACEAWEEAGALGRVSEVSIGAYTYAKDMGNEDFVPCLVMLYPLKVKSLKRSYPEHAERRRQWVSRKKAARMVGAADLSRLILDFEPSFAKLKT
ncbi:MAG: NUDIX hydrolase [Pseudomonadota bacterium]